MSVGVGERLDINTLLKRLWIEVDKKAVCPQEKRKFSTFFKSFSKSNQQVLHSVKPLFDLADFFFDLKILFHFFFYFLAGMHSGGVVAAAKFRPDGRK